MAKGRWKKSEEHIAIEAHAVLIKNEISSKTYTKKLLQNLLMKVAIYQSFLRLCLEHDDSSNLEEFRRGLLLVLRSLGPTRASKMTGISRMTLYRMLSKQGNPRLSSLIRLLKTLGLHLWIVDTDFKYHKRKIMRPKDQKYLEPDPHALLKIDY